MLKSLGNTEIKGKEDSNVIFLASIGEETGTHTHLSLKLKYQ